MLISIIVAVANNNIIGKKNALPWYLPADLNHFKETTMGHAIIMGQTTHQSIGRSLPGRTNIVISKDQNYKSEGVTIAHSLEEALEVAKKNNESEVFIIGGASVYKQTIDLADKLYMTKIHHDFDGDVYFPEVDKDVWQQVSRKPHSSDDKNPYSYEFIELTRR